MTGPIYRWHSYIDDGQGFVREYEDDELKITFGPMPVEAIGPFIDDRREQIEETVERLKTGNNRGMNSLRRNL